MMTTYVRRTVAAMCAVIATMAPAVGSAQTLAPENRGLKIREWRWSESEPVSRAASLVQAGPSVRRPQARQRQRHSRQYRDVQRVLAAFALGTVGFLAGSMVSLLAPVDYRITGSIGAAGGATAGVLLVR
jgi:hypothetical protein